MTDVEAATAPRTEPAPGATPPATPPAAAPAEKRHRLRYVAVAVVFAAAIGLLLAKGLGGSLDYFDTVDQAVSHQATLQGKTVRLEGVVVPGTVVRTATGVDFVAAGTTHRIAVRNTGNPPQLFQPNVPVVVVGHFVAGGFASTQIIVDHSAQYIEQHPARVRAPDGSTR